MIQRLELQHIALRKDSDVAGGNGGCCSLTAAASRRSVVDQEFCVQILYDFFFHPSCIASYHPTHSILREEPKEGRYLPSVLSFHRCFPFLTVSFLSTLPFLTFFVPFSSLHLYLEPVSIPPAHRHEVTYVTTHKGPSLAAIFSRDGTSQFQRFLNLQVSVLVHFSLLRSTCCYCLC